MKKNHFGNFSRLTCSLAQVLWFVGAGAFGSDSVPVVELQELRV